MLGPMGHMGHWLVMEVHRVSLDMRLVVGGRRGGLGHDLNSERGWALLQHQKEILHDFIDLNEYSMTHYIDGIDPHLIL